MAADYEGFAVVAETSPGVFEPVGAGVSVAVRIEGVGSDAAESPLSTDANGEIAAGTIAAATAGDVLNFRVQNNDGLAGTVSQTTT